MTTQTEFDDIAGIRLLASDLTTVTLLFNEARYRTLERVFGIPREQVNAATLVLLLAFAAGMRERSLNAATAARSAPGKLTATDIALGAGVMREGLHGIAGPSFDKEPLFGTLLAIAALAHISRPIVARSLNAVHARTHQARLAFDHRYGHLIRRHRDRLQKIAAPITDRS